MKVVAGINCIRTDVGHWWNESYDIPTPVCEPEPVDVHVMLRLTR